MESYFHIDLNNENYMEQIQNMVNQLQNSITTYQNNHSENSNHQNNNSENSNHQNNHSENSNHQNNHSENSNHQNNHSENSNHQINYLIQFEFDIDLQNENIQENLPNYFKNSKQIDQELGKSLYITKNDKIIDNKECLICLDKFEYKKYKRILKCCNNTYHKTCIDKWLKKNSSCPTCRFDLLPIQSNYNFVQEEKTNDDNQEINININNLQNDENI